MVACPICWQKMKLQEVDRHIATGSCPGAPQPQTQLQAPVLNGTSSRSSKANFLSSSRTKSSQPAKPLAHLPALNYSMLKDKSLREKLADLNISIYGSRQLLEQRHKEWVTIWNANCDSAHPKTRAELLRDLDTWERTMSSAVRTTGFQAAQPQVKDKNFDGASWATSHDTSFKDLIAKARQTKKQAEQKARDASASEPASAVGKSNAEEVIRREEVTPGRGLGPRDVPNRYQNAINGFGGAADFAVPVSAEQAQGWPNEAYKQPEQPSHHGPPANVQPQQWQPNHQNGPPNEQDERARVGYPFGWPRA